MEHTEIQRIGFTHDELNEALVEYVIKRGMGVAFQQAPRQSWQITGLEITPGSLEWQSGSVIYLTKARPAVGQVSEKGKHRENVQSVTEQQGG